MGQMFSRALLALALMSLGACDFIRFPGDGGPPPAVPEPGPELPPGAPGPPPPTDPVNPLDDESDPSDTTDADTPPPTDTADATDTAIDPTTPGTDTSTDTVSDTETPDTDTGPVVDVPDTGLDTDETSGDATDPADNSDTPSVPEDPAPVEPAFSYFAPGVLLNGSGQGDTDQIVHAPDIVFPIKEAPTYLQSMVFTFGGGIGGGDQCDARNYAYPWRDNFCESRSANRGSPFCPTNKIHQGQDIRVGTPEGCNTLRRTPAADRDQYEVVAVEDGIISNVGSYSVNLRAGGRIYKYMHMNMKKLAITSGQFVKAGDTLGYVSNDFGGTPTTFHLHFEIVENTAEHGWVHVPPYLSLVAAYERREKGPGELIEAGAVGVASAPVVIPEGFEIVE